MSARLELFVPMRAAVDRKGARKSGSLLRVAPTRQIAKPAHSPSFQPPGGARQFAFLDNELVQWGSARARVYLAADRVAHSAARPTARVIFDQVATSFLKSRAASP